MISSNKFFLIILLLFLSATSNAQTLKVIPSEDSKKVNRNAKKGTSTVIFDSKVKNLVIDSGWDDVWIKPSDNLFVYMIDTGKDLEAGFEFSKRIFSLTCPEAAEYLLELDNLIPNQVLYYTVVLPEQYTSNLSLEYLFSGTAPYGIRIACGRRFGLYLSYQQGRIGKSGADISSVSEDCDVTRATELGFIRTGITGGLRIGILHKNKTSLYALVGGGYGEYGRQWENPLEISGSSYFFSDYIRGFEGELACQCVLFDWLTASIGTDMVIGDGKVSLDYQIGVGVNLNIDRIFRNRKIQ